MKIDSNEHVVVEANTYSVGVDPILLFERDQQITSALEEVYTPERRQL